MPRHVSGAPARGGIPETWDRRQDRQSGGWPRLRRPAIVCSCREAVTERDDFTPDKLARPPRRRGRRRRKPVTSPPASAGGLIPPVIKVEIQNIERLAGSRDDSAVAEREAQVSAATRELEAREARLAASAVELRQRERRVAELEDALGPAADVLESRESIERRERRVRELETSLRDRAQDLEQRENDHEARKAVRSRPRDARGRGQAAGGSPRHPRGAPRGATARAGRLRLAASEPLRAPGHIGPSGSAPSLHLPADGRRTHTAWREGTRVRG